MIKSLLIHTIAAALLLPILSTTASAKKYGGFKTGYTFTLRVKKVSSVEATGIPGSGTTKKVEIPDGLPKFRKGQKVRFKIGRRGKLVFKGAKIPFREDAGYSNLYRRAEPMSVAATDDGQVIKTKKNKAEAVFLNFTRLSGGPGKTVTYSLSYTLR